MLLKYIYDEHLAQASYLVGCAATGEALVVDPARDIAPYLALAEGAGLRVTHIAETHIHADFVSGSRELAAATGATIYLSDMGDAVWKYAYASASNVIPVRDGDHFMVGNIRIEVMHTPGHTPEHISFVVTDTAAADAPIGIFTGDFVFVGDVGRPDLLEEAAGMMGTKEPGARQQFASVRRLRALPDYLQLWPGHGAGSACGKALGAIPSTTLGYERRFNPAFQFEDESAFVAWLLDGQPEAPRYFAHMKQVNKQGPALLGALPPLARLDAQALDAAIKAGGFVVDLRPQADFEAAHLPGTVSIPATSRSFSTYLGWWVDYHAPTYFIVPSEDALPALLDALRAIGIDHIGGYALPDVIDERAVKLPTLSADALAQRASQNGLVILDVRGHAEYCEGHIQGAKHLMLGMLPAYADALPRDVTLVTQCASGYRSQIAASWLRARGFTNVINLRDGVTQWSQALPTATCKSESPQATG